MKIYFAGPLFNSAEKEYNLKLVNELESIGFEVFLPQRDGVEKNKHPYNVLDPKDRRKALFEIDRDQILSSDIFLFVLDGRVPDEGACVELGIAYTHKYLQNVNKYLIGLHTDTRAAFMGSKLNPMINVPLDDIFSSEEELFSFLSTKK